MSGETDALNGLKAVLQTVVVPAGNDALSGVYRWPFDVASVPDTVVLPMIVVGMANAPVTNPDEVARKAQGLERRRWTADILVYVGEGPLTVMDDYAAAIEGKTIGWVEAVADALWKNMTLGGNVTSIGRASGDVMNLFTSVTGHLHWGYKQYWGLHISLPVMQARHVEMKA